MYLLKFVFSQLPDLDPESLRKPQKQVIVVRPLRGVGGYGPNGRTTSGGTFLRLSLCIRSLAHNIFKRRNSNKDENLAPVFSDGSGPDPVNLRPGSTILFLL